MRPIDFRPRVSCASVAYCGPLPPAPMRRSARVCCVIACWRPFHLQLRPPVVAKHSWRSTRPTPAWARRRRARRCGVLHLVAPCNSVCNRPSPICPNGPSETLVSGNPCDANFPHPQSHVQDAPYRAAPFGSIMPEVDQEWIRAYRDVSQDPCSRTTLQSLSAHAISM